MTRATESTYRIAIQRYGLKGQKIKPVEFRNISLTSKHNIDALKKDIEKIFKITDDK